jgi:hypothetical protein
MVHPFLRVPPGARRAHAAHVTKEAAMQAFTGARAFKAVGAWALLAVAVPLFGLALIPFVALAAVGRPLVLAAGAIARRLRSADRRWPVPGTFGLLR